MEITVIGVIQVITKIGTNYLSSKIYSLNKKKQKK